MRVGYNRGMQQTIPGLEEAVALLTSVDALVVTTGAGMSSESGIPTFRDAPGAVWANYDPADLATPEGFLRDPALVWRWYADRRAIIAGVRPHEGHRAIAALEALYEPFLLLTQNIDNLHRAAGSTRIIELHGNIFRYKCFDRGHKIERLPETAEVPPRCACGSMIRPDVVWFGELLDSDHLELAYGALVSCGALLVVGTSGIVYPAAGFPALAKQAGARVIEVNREETPITDIADVSLRARAGDALHALVSAIRERRGAGQP